MAAEPTPEPETAPEQQKPAKKASAKKPPADTPRRQRQQKQANEQADQQAEETFDEPTDEKDDLPDEREEWFRAPGFQRMKMDWSPDERRQMDRMQGGIEAKVVGVFADALGLMNEIWSVVREQEVNTTTGEMVVDAFGFAVWHKDPISGRYFEDWSRLTYRQREDFLFQITTTLFDWEQRRERLWTEAMFGKAMFTERFAIEYDAPMTGTIDDRNAVANAKAAEDRYFALMLTSVSRRADAIVRTLTNIALRLRDTIQQGA